MIKPAALLTWPTHLDYPVCRWNLERFKDYFDGIYIGFSNHHVENQDLTNFIREKLPFAVFTPVKRTRDDWRNDSVNCLLDAVKSDYVCFMEQDFLIKDEKFFEKVFEKEYDFIYYNEQGRKHPAFAVVKREVVEKTSRNFSAIPPGDHFYKFFNEVGEGVDIETLGVEHNEDFYHMAGLSQNYMNFKYGDPFFKPINFLYYNYKSSLFPNQHPFFQQLQLSIERTYGHSPEHTFLNNFFPEEVS